MFVLMIPWSCLQQSLALDHAKEAQLRHARFEIGQLTMVKTANAEEARAMGERITVLEAELKAHEVVLAEAQRQRDENESLRDMSEFSKEAQRAAELQRDDATRASRRPRRAEDEETTALDRPARRLGHVVATVHGVGRRARVRGRCVLGRPISDLAVVDREKIAGDEREGAYV